MISLFKKTYEIWKVAKYENSDVLKFTKAISGWNGIMCDFYFLLISQCINIIRVFCILCNNY